MNSLNASKEQTKTDSTTVETGKSQTRQIPLSLHTNQAPSYTFTPLVKRPKVTASPENQPEKTTMNPPSNTDNNEVTKTQGGFAFTPVVDEPVVEQIETVNDTAELAAETEISAAHNEPEKSENNTFERVIPVVAPTKKLVKKCPVKYRRLILVLLLLLLLFIFFLLLKPKAPETLQTLNEQSHSLPIEFRPVDEEEAKRAEERAKALHKEQATPTIVAEVPQPAPENVKKAEQAAASQPEMAKTDVPKATPKPNQAALDTLVASLAEPEKPRRMSEQSVIYQPEVVKQPSQPKKVEPSAKAVATKPAPTTKTVHTPNAAVTSKTLTVPKGVSLMQVFRDNHLNISDVNAMSKVNSVVSRLKAGEKVVVHLDKNNRVIEMGIGSGGKFIRQTNGSYIYQ